MKMADYAALIRPTAWEGKTMAWTYTDGPTTTSPPAVGQPIPKQGAPAPGTKLTYSSKCVGGRVQLIETAWITFNSPAGSRLISKSDGSSEDQYLVCQVLIVATHIIKTNEPCDPKKTKPPYDEGKQSEEQFGLGLKDIQEKAAAAAPAPQKKQDESQDK